MNECMKKYVPKRGGRKRKYARWMKRKNPKVYIIKAKEKQTDQAMRIR